MMRPSLRRLVAGVSIVLACGWTIAAQNAQPPIPPGPNTLFGRVVDSTTGAPIGGAQVTLMGYSGPSDIPSMAFYGRGLPASADTSEPRGLITNGDGDFLFGQLPAGRYAVFVTAFGYLMSGYQAATTASPVHLIDVTDNARATPIVVRLVKGGSISGTVLDDRGDPIVDAPVQAFARSGPDLWPIGSGARTDDRGVYRLAQLPPDRYVVGVVTAARTIPAALGATLDATSDRFALSSIRRQLIPTLEMDLSNGEGVRAGNWVLQRKGPVPPPAPDGRMLAYTTTLYPSAALPSDAETIALGSGEERTGIDMTMRVVPAVTISGVAIGPDGPMENTSVRLNLAHTGDDRDVSPTSEITTITTASGAFTFLGVPQGQYVIESSFTPADQAEGAPVMTVWARQPLAADRDVSGLTLTLRTGMKVSGRVDFRGGPMPPRVQIILSPQGGIWQRTLGLVVGPDGRFVSGGHPPGRYQVHAAAAGSSVVSMSLGGQRLSDDTIALESSDIAGLTITMSSTPSHVTGSVVDTNGVPAPRANVIAFPADTMAWRQDGMELARRCFVAASSAGAFSCSGLEIGDYYFAAIDAQTPYRYSDTGFYERLVPGASRVTVTENGASQVALKLFTPKEK